MDRLRRDGRAPCWAAARSCWPGWSTSSASSITGPILRSTILTAFLGYSLLIVALLIDVGRPQNILLARPVYFINIHSVLWEVAICVLCYTTVLALEFAPALFERLRWKRAWQITHKITLPLVIVGILLSTMHQSSLGSLWLIAPGKLNDLWYTPWLPVFFWISAIAVGIGDGDGGVEPELAGVQARAGARPAGKPGESSARSCWPSTPSSSSSISSGAARPWLLTAPTLQAVLFWIEVGLCAMRAGDPAVSARRCAQHSNALFAVGGAGRVPAAS